MKMNAKPKNAIQREALVVLCYEKHDLKKIPTNVDAIEPKLPEGRRNFYLSCARTYARIVRAIEEAKTDPQLVVAMKLSFELLDALPDYADVCGSTVEDRVIVEEIFGDDIK